MAEDPAVEDMQRSAAPWASHYREHLERIPEHYHNLFLQVVQRNRAPVVVGAAIDYHSRDATQQEVADAWGVSRRQVGEVWRVEIRGDGDG